MEHVLHKIRISYGTIRRISKYFNKKTLLLLYDTMVVSHIRYCITTWFNGNKTTALKIQQAANKFIRMIFKLQARDNVGKVMKENNILSIEQINNLEVASFMFKYQKNKLPHSFNNFFQNNVFTENNKHNTRSQSKFFSSFSRLNLTKQSFKYKGLVFWNKVPFNIKQSKSLRKFRNDLQMSLIQK